jgi:hypothetical protein
MGANGQPTAKEAIYDGVKKPMAHIKTAIHPSSVPANGPAAVVPELVAAHARMQGRVGRRLFVSALVCIPLML